MNGKLTGKALTAQIIPRGNDGVSPVISVEDIEGGHRIVIEDIHGIHHVDVMNGSGVNILGSYDSEEELIAAHPRGNVSDCYLVSGNLYVWNAVAGVWLNAGNIKGEKGDPGEQGIRGEKGDPGNDGHTPVKGTDYFTDSEKQEMIAAAAEAAKPTDYLKKTGDTMTGALVAHNNTAYTTGQVRNIFLVAEGEDLPSGSNGDICLVYTP